MRLYVIAAILGVAIWFAFLFFDFAACKRKCKTEHGFHIKEYAFGNEFVCRCGDEE